jgi:hypothetical protein
MRRIAALTLPALSVLALPPAVSGATANDLRGAPQMFRVSAATVRVQFTTDRRLNPKATVRIAVSNAGTGRKATADGRHGRDFNYVSVVKLHRPLEVGKKYRVRFSFGHDDPIVRKVVLRSA